MHFLHSTRRVSRPGSATYALELADCLRRHRDPDDGCIILGPTDATIAEKALRSRAGCGLLRATTVVGIGLFAVILIVGIPDRNGDGKVDLADVALGVQSVFAATPHPLARAENDKGRLKHPVLE